MNPPPPFRLAARTIVQVGILIRCGESEVYVSEDTLVQLAEQGRWDSQFGKSAVTLDGPTGEALVSINFAEKETRGGYHGTPALMEFVTGRGWL